LFRPGFSVAGDFSRVSHRGKFDTCPVCRCPGFAASSEILLPRRMETPNPNPEARASGEHRRIALLGVRLRDDLSPWRKTAVRNVRDNNAARVAGPGRICFLILTPRPPRCTTNSSARVILSEAEPRAKRMARRSRRTPIHSQSSLRRREFSRWISTFTPISRMEVPTPLRRECYQLALVPPSPPGSWNHRVGGNFWTWSLKHKDLYQSIAELRSYGRVRERLVFGGSAQGLRIRQRVPAPLTR
jgi:hypothetical protein